MPSPIQPYASGECLLACAQKGHQDLFPLRKLRRPLPSSASPSRSLGLGRDFEGCHTPLTSAKYLQIAFVRSQFSISFFLVFYFLFYFVFSLFSFRFCFWGVLPFFLFFF